MGHHTQGLTCFRWSKHHWIAAALLAAGTLSACGRIGYGDGLAGPNDPDAAPDFADGGADLGTGFGAMNGAGGSANGGTGMGGVPGTGGAIGMGGGGGAPVAGGGGMGGSAGTGTGGTMTGGTAGTGTGGTMTGGTADTGTGGTMTGGTAGMGTGGTMTGGTAGMGTGGTMTGGTAGTGTGGTAGTGTGGTMTGGTAGTGTGGTMTGGTGGACSMANLVANPSFEIDGPMNYPASWVRFGANGTRVTDEAHTGTASFRVTQPFQIVVPQGTVPQPAPALNPGRNYELSGWMRVGNLGNMRGLYILFRQTQPLVLMPLAETGIQAQTGGWQRFVLTFATPANFGAGQAELGWLLDSGDQAWFDDIDLHEICP